jgi:hypothetical protein
LSKRLPILLVLALGCGDPPKKAAPEIPVFCQPSGQLNLLSQPEVYENTTVTVHAGALVFSCDGGSDVAVDVEARVSSPEGRSLPARLTVNTAPYEDPDGGLAVIFFFSQFGMTNIEPDGGALVRADITFDVGDAGLYAMNLKFKPGLGSLQGEVLAMVDRRDHGVHALPMPYECGAFDRWGDLMPCQEGNQLVVLRDDGGIAFTQMNDVFMVTDAGLWTVEGGVSTSLSLWSLVDDQVQLVAHGPLPPSFTGWAPGQGPAMAAGAGTMLLFWQNELVLASPSDGGIVIEPKAELLQLAQGGGYGMVLLPGEGAIVSDQGIGPNMFSFCTVSFRDAGASCRTDRFAIGADDDVLWVIDGSTAVTAYQLAPGPKLIEHPTPFHQGFTAFPNFSQSVLPLQSDNASNSSTLGTPYANFDGFPIGALARIPQLTEPPTVASYGMFSLQPQTGATPRVYWSLDAFNMEMRYIER